MHSPRRKSMGKSFIEQAKRQREDEATKSTRKQVVVGYPISASCGHVACEVFAQETTSYPMRDSLGRDSTLYLY